MLHGKPVRLLCSSWWTWAAKTSWEVSHTFEWWLGEACTELIKYLHVQWTSQCDHLPTSFMLCLFRSPPVRWGSLDLVSAVVWATGVSALCQASGLCVAPAPLPMHQAMRVCWNSMNFARAIARISFRIHIRTYDIYIYVIWTWVKIRYPMISL